MALLNQIPEYIRDKNNHLRVKAPEVYIDDIFDPLFNANAKAYLQDKYGWGTVGNTLAGYTELLENSLLGQEDQWGILGPGMGILSSFGRSMDKAGDFLIGSATETVNALGNNILGSGVKPENPLTNIFVNDEDYSGTRLLAAMANSMSSFAGGAKIDESDFGTAGNIAGTGLDLLLDPGILGSTLSKKYTPELYNLSRQGKVTSKEILRNLGKNNNQSLVGEIGQLLSNYDDLMANVSIDLTAPGLRFAISKTINKINDLVQAQSPKGYKNTKLEGEGSKATKNFEDFSDTQNTSTRYTNFNNFNTDIDSPPNSSPTPPKGPTPPSTGGISGDVASQNISTLEDMLDNLVYKYDISYTTDPELFRQVAEVKESILGKLDPLENTQDILEYQNKLNEYYHNFTNELESFRKTQIDELNTVFSNKGYGGQLMSNLNTYGSDYSNLIRDAANEDKFIEILSEYFDNVNYDNVSDWAKIVDEGLLEDYLDREDMYNLLNTLKQNFPGVKSHSQPIKIYESQYLERNSKAGLLALEAFDTELSHLLTDLSKTYNIPYTDFNSFKDWIVDASGTFNDIPVKAGLHLQQHQPAGFKYFKPDSNTHAVPKVSNKNLDELLEDSLNAYYPRFNRVDSDFVEQQRIENIFNEIQKNKKIQNVSTKPKYNEPRESHWRSYVTQNTEDPIEEAVKRYVSDMKALEEFRANYHYTAPQQGYVFTPDTNFPNKHLLSKWDLEQLEQIKTNIFNKYTIKKEIPSTVGKNGKTTKPLQYKIVSQPEFLGYDPKTNTYGFKIKSKEGKIDVITVKKPDYIQNVSTKNVKSYNPKTPVKTIPGLKYLIEAKTHSASKNFVTDYLTNVKKFIDWAKEMEIRGARRHPALSKIIDFALNYEKHYLDKLYDIARGTDNSVYSLSPVNTINKMLSLNPRFLRDPVTGKFKVKEFLDLRKKLPSFDVKITHTDELLDVTDNLLEGYSKESIKSFINALQNVKPGKDGNYYYYSALKKYIGTKENQRPLYPFVHYLTDPKISKEVRLTRMKNLLDGKIALTDLTKFAKGSYIDETPSFKSLSNIGEALQNMHLEKAKMNENYRFSLNVQTFAEKEVKKLPTPEFAKTVTTKQSTNTFIYYKMMDDMFSDYTSIAPDIESLGYYIRRYGTPKDRYLFDLIQDSLAVPVKNKSGDYAVLRNKKVQELDIRAHHLDKNIKPSVVQNYQALNDAARGDIVKGSDFANSVVYSGGFQITILKQNKPEVISRIRKSLTNNVQKLDPEGKVFKIVEAPLNSDEMAIGVVLNTSNKNLIKDFKKLKKVKDLEDIIWEVPNSKAKKALVKKEYLEIDKLFKDSEEFSKELTIKLGHPAYSEGYVKHSQLNTPEAGDYLAYVYKQLEIDLELAQEASSYIINTSKGMKGNLDTLPYDRHLRGNILRYNNGSHQIFSNNLQDIIRSTYTKGMLDSSTAQTFIDLFVNDNFKLTSVAKDKNVLKNILYATDDVTGKYTGNLTNMSLVAPKYNDAGAIVGFTHYDKLTDAGLDKALANSETILVPTHVISYLDALCKNNVKMANSFYVFVNKFLNLPFKLGAITNPAFLVSNFSDAYFKQAVTMANKYGTSVTEELANVVDCVRLVTVINNQFFDVYEKYVRHMTSLDETFDIFYKNPSSLGMSKKAQKHFIDFLNSRESYEILSKDERDVIHFYLYINNFQNTATFKAELKGMPNANTSNFNDPRSFIEKVLYGSDKNWGMVTNNPISEGILNGSATIETIMRSATILNDLLHKGYSFDDIKHILGLNPSLEKEVRQKLDVEMSEAINTMYSAQFNYESTGPAIDIASNIMPFPTFFLKNFAYWLELFNENPRLIHHIVQTQQGLWAGQDTEEDKFKAEAKGRGAIPISSGQNLSTFFKGIYKPSPLNSMFGAFSLLNDPISDIKYRLHPALQLTTSIFEDPKEVKYRPYTTNQYERNITKDNPKFNSLEYMFHKFNPYERVVNTYLRTPSKFEKGNAQLSDILPSIFQPDF